MTIDIESRRAKLYATWVLAAVALAACGGGGDTAETPAPGTPPPSGTPSPGTPSPPPSDTPIPPPSPPPGAPPPTTPSPPAGTPGYVTIGGTVSGLSGPVRLESGAGSVDVSASGDFTFPGTVAAGTAYTVSIASLPNKQNCVLTNASGTTDSANVADVGVVCHDRVWTLGQQLDGDDQPVTGFDAGIDKEGNVTALFVKGDRLYVVRGAPGTSTGAVQWSAPVRLDTDAIPFSAGLIDRTIALAFAPNGRVHVVWSNRAPCGLGYAPPSSNICAYLYSTLYTPSSNTWSSPVLISDTPGSVNGPYLKPTPMINDRGDVAVHFGWYNQVSPPNLSNTNLRDAVAWRAAGQETFQKRAFADIQTENSRLVLDSAGNMVVAGQKAQTNSSNKDILWYDGNVAAGFAATEGTILDTLNNQADLRDFSIGPTGDILLTWDQNDASGPKIFAASRSSATSAWSTPVAFISLISEGVGFVTDDGDAMFYAGCTAYERSRATGVWGPKTPPMPSGCGFTESGAARTGDGSFLTYASNGLWNTYYHTNYAMARESGAPLTSTDYLLGFAKSWGSSRKWVYTKKPDGNFIGAFLAIEEYDTLPTSAAPSGDGRNGIHNLWGFYLK